MDKIIDKWWKRSVYQSDKAFSGMIVGDQGLSHGAPIIGPHPQPTDSRYFGRESPYRFKSR
jgi:hypothetical protein